MTTIHDLQSDRDNARERTARYLRALQQCHGKIAILRHENNQLRKKVRKS